MAVIDRNPSKKDNQAHSVYNYGGFDEFFSKDRAAAICVNCPRSAAYLMADMALNQSLAALVSAPNTASLFLLYAMERSYDSLREISSGDGGRGGLNKKLLKQYTVNVPSSIEEQKEISGILACMDDEIASLEAEYDKMQQIKAGMMDDLLTGRVRLIG